LARGFAPIHGVLSMHRSVELIYASLGNSDKVTWAACAVKLPHIGRLLGPKKTGSVGGRDGSSGAGDRNRTQASHRFSHARSSFERFPAPSCLPAVVVSFLCGTQHMPHWRLPRVKSLSFRSVGASGCLKMCACFSSPGYCSGSRVRQGRSEMDRASRVPPGAIPAGTRRQRCRRK